MAASSVVAVPMITPPTFTDGTLAPLYVPSETEAIEDSYIVVFKNNVHADSLLQHMAWVNNLVLAGQQDEDLFSERLRPDTIGIRHVYDTPNMKGYSGKFGKDALEMIRRSEEVYWEKKKGKGRSD